MNKKQVMKNKCCGEEYEKIICKERVAEEYDIAHEEQPVLNVDIDDGKVNVNFYLESKLIFSKRYSLDTSVEHLKAELFNTFEVLSDIQIMHWHVFLNDTKTLRYIARECTCEINLTVVNLNAVKPPDMVVPDIITVQIDCDGVYKEVTVEIEDRRLVKHFLGGYVDEETGIEYHNANTQCNEKERNKVRLSPRNQNSRATQTVWTRNRKEQARTSRATQVQVSNIYIPNVADKILTVKRYETAAEYHERVVKNVKIIQRYYRAWKMRKWLKLMSAEYHRRQNLLELEDQQLEEFTDKLLRKEIANKFYPRSNSDFKKLYTMVERWKKAETQRIAHLHQAKRLSEYYTLLEKEVELLRIIEKKRVQIKQQIQAAKELEFLETISKPIEWIGYKGLSMSMDTLETQMGRRFKEIYFLTSTDELSKEDRIQFLTELSTYLKEHNCVIGNELNELVEREIKLLTIGTDNENLDMLNKRIQALLLKHYRTPECNINVTKRMKKQTLKNLRYSLCKCRTCGVVLPIVNFMTGSYKNLRRECASCVCNDVIMEPGIQPNGYQLILDILRRDEYRLGASSSVAFILQEKDIKYLVDNIWNRKSAISEKNDLLKLRLVRWNVQKDWSPWNCILLTDEEAKAHLGIKCFDDVYDKVFQKTMIMKHAESRTFFSFLLERDKFVREHDKVILPHEPYEECKIDEEFETLSLQN